MLLALDAARNTGIACYQLTSQLAWLHSRFCPVLMHLGAEQRCRGPFKADPIAAMHQQLLSSQGHRVAQPARRALSKSEINHDLQAACQGSAT